MVGSSLPQGSSTRVRSRLSPVREGRHSEETSVEALPERPEESAPIELGFDMVIPAPKADKAKAPHLLAPPTKSASIPGPASTPTDNPFARRPVAPARPGKSALSAMLADSSGSSSTNPFTELYSAIAARAESDSMVVNVYFPHAREPAGKPLKLKVRKDASVEEVLGFALWSYWEENWLPKIDEGLQGEEDPKWESRCSAVGWILRIAEDDGEVDEDFPRKSLSFYSCCATVHFSPYSTGSYRQDIKVQLRCVCCSRSDPSPRYVHAFNITDTTHELSTISPTKQGVGKQDPAESLAHCHQEEEIRGPTQQSGGAEHACTTCRLAPRDQRWPQLARVFRRHVPQFTRPIDKPWPASILADPDRGYGGCGARFDNHPSVCPLPCCV